MLANVVMQTGYSLYQKKALEITGFNEWTAAYYNNILTIPTIIIVLLAVNELPGVMAFDLLGDPAFGCVVLWSGVCGFLISLSIFWAINKTSPATFSVVGSLNKLPMTVLGSYLYDTPFTTLGGISAFVSLAGGVVFSATKFF
eukprot:TRINITY_DN4648_c2_g1_i1.p1 TRINITY_DN4648_c2_g1~~TRINITY_DN4648_c2_g1_i1.p1  ORF type:complete len:143 (+),score=18.66 TRINITY_DN4648_c2_g1_i1:221-649(+)